MQQKRDKFAADRQAEWAKEGKTTPGPADLAQLALDYNVVLEKEIAEKAAGFLVEMYGIYRQSFTDVKKGTRTKESSVGSAGSIAAHGFLNLKPELIAALTGSDGGNLDWLGNAAGTKDFMHFQLKDADRPALK